MMNRTKKQEFKPVNVSGCNKLGARWLMIYLISVCSVFLASATDLASAGPLEDAVAAAKAEGTINAHLPSGLGLKGAQELADAFNKRHAINVKLNFFSSGGYTKDVAKVVSQSALGVPPDWDVLTVTENLQADLAQKALLRGFDYKLLSVDPRSVQHGGHSVTVSHELVLPTYNRNVLAEKDVPTKWEDLLNPKWKDGKLGVPDATYYFALLAVGPWGERKTTEYIRGLATQRPFLGRGAELYTRLQLGEIVVAALMFESLIHRARQGGAPVVFAEGVEPIIVSTNNIAVLKGAAHPNAAALFAAFMTSPEAQTIWDKYYGLTSAFIPGTRTYNFMRGKKAVYMGGQNPKVVERLSNEYSKILGFTR
jgi:ABC-type Fe3+ transport system substrate-binding protein